MLRKDDGFTLLELLIVIVIIGVLITIGIISFKSIINKANRNVCLANQRTIETARNYHYLINGTYGKDAEDLKDVFKLMGFKSWEDSEILICPSKGKFLFTPNVMDIVCSIEGHN